MVRAATVNAIEVNSNQGQSFECIILMEFGDGSSQGLSARISPNDLLNNVQKGIKLVFRNENLLGTWTIIVKQDALVSKLREEKLIVLQ